MQKERIISSLCAHHPAEIVQSTPDNYEIIHLNNRWKSRVTIVRRKSHQKLPCVILWLHTINGSGWQCVSLSWILMPAPGQHTNWSHKQGNKRTENVKSAQKNKIMRALNELNIGSKTRVYCILYTVKSENNKFIKMVFKAQRTTEAPG